jgi:site-specific DNA-methyltransferase (adenine-specific)
VQGRAVVSVRILIGDCRERLREMPDFEIRDQLAWVYGSGFPKSHNQAGGWGTALKPSWEPIALARKALSGTVAANMAKWGTGALNIDGCRIGMDEAERETVDARSGAGFGTGNTVGAHQGREEGERFKSHAQGRWPANLCHDGSDEVAAAFPETTSGAIDPARHVHKNGKGVALSGSADGSLNNYLPHQIYEGDSGSAARFFYCAKATTEERGEGNVHPTVKPIVLMRWLVRLVTPKGGTVLDPFMGSGSTLIAADAEQFNAIGCELSPEYVAIAERRIRDAAGMFADVAIADRNPTGGDVKQAPSRSDESGGGEANRQRDAA